MGLYGTNIAFDRRELVGFARDISLIPDEDYASVQAPSSVRQFPGDLRNPNLEFSGVYEDGWVSEAAFFELTQPPSATTVSVRGLLPLVGDSTFTCDMKVLIDGQLVANKTLRPGAFEVDVPVATPPGKHRVDLRFSRLQRLVAPDTRPVGSLLQSVEFTPAPAVADAGNPLPDVTTPSSGLAVAGDGWYPVETFDQQSFRWVSNDALVVLPASNTADRSLRMELEAGPGLGPSPFTLQVFDADNRILAAIPVSGRQTISIAVPPTPGAAASLRLHVEGGGQPAPNDSRILNFRVFALSMDRGP